MVDPEVPNAEPGGHDREPRPSRGAGRGAGNPSAEGGAFEEETPSSDDDLELLEQDLRAALGPRGAGAGGEADGQTAETAETAGHAWRDPRPGSPAAARPSFRASLRASFVSGRFEGDGAPPAHVDRALGGWRVPAASAEARARVREAFLGAADHAQLAAAPASEAGTSRASASGADVHRSAPRPRRSRTAERRDLAGRERRQVRASGSRGLWMAAGAVAMLAAVFLALVVLRGDRGPSWAPAGAQHGAEVAGLELRGVQVNGRAAQDLDDLMAQLAGGAIVTTGEASLRLVMDDEFVLEIGAGSEVVLPDLAAGGALEIQARRGAVRVATAAAFRAAERELVVSSAHVRTVVRGTVFGLDVTDDYSCICCLEGEVAAEVLIGDLEPCRVAAGRTRLVLASARSTEMDLVAHHSGPLESLATFW